MAASDLAQQNLKAFQVSTARAPQEHCMRRIYPFIQLWRDPYPSFLPSFLPTVIVSNSNPIPPSHLPRPRCTQLHMTLTHVTLTHIPRMPRSVCTTGMLAVACRRTGCGGPPQKLRSPPRRATAGSRVTRGMHWEGEGDGRGVEAATSVTCNILQTLASPSPPAFCRLSAVYS